MSKDAIKSGDRVLVTNELSDWFGAAGEVFNVDAGDPGMPYKVMLDVGMAVWFGPEDLDPAR